MTHNLKALNPDERERLEILDKLIHRHRLAIAHEKMCLGPLLHERSALVNRGIKRGHLRESQKGRQVRKYERRVEI